MKTGSDYIHVEKSQHLTSWHPPSALGIPGGRRSQPRTKLEKCFWGEKKTSSYASEPRRPFWKGFVVFLDENITIISDRCILLWNLYETQMVHERNSLNSESRMFTSSGSSIMGACLLMGVEHPSGSADIEWRSRRELWWDGISSSRDDGRAADCKILSCLCPYNVYFNVSTTNEISTITTDIQISNTIEIWIPHRSIHTTYLKMLQR